MGGAISAPVTYLTGSRRTDGESLEDIQPHEATQEMSVDSVDDGVEDDEVNENNSDISRKEKLKEQFDEFKDELDKKREERRAAISRIADELNRLRDCKHQLEEERTIRLGMEKQIHSLKEVSNVSNEMIKIRESQLADLKKRLKEMESSTDESLRELRSRYEQQMENVNKLRRLYEERADAVSRGHQSELEREKAKYALLELKMAEVTNQGPEIEQYQSKITELEQLVAGKEEELETEKELRYSSELECKNLTSQLTLINNLFSNLLTGNELDFDFLTQLLQDNHNLITDLIANGDINETAALLFNIAEKVYKKSESSTETDSEMQITQSARDEIASNLPKVWRVLIELLSRHIDCANTVQGGSEECYKNVKTSHGSRTVISVSQTFLRLKDLILEKNSLVKEVGRLKTLNGHLENRLDLQEKRLGTVCSELRKTWGIVSKLKVQHRQLHTNEKILRYELHHKRQMLTDLKDELKYCRDTWDVVRAKNTQSEHDWEILRKEFALRKNRDASNSGESGYEDDETSQSPDVSVSDSDCDISSDGQKSIELEEDHPTGAIEFEDAASDATVIELIDMLELDPESVRLVQTDEADPTDENNRTDPTACEERYENLEQPISSDANETADSVCSSGDDTLEVCALIAGSSSASDDRTCSSSTGKTDQRSSEEILQARAERLKRLEIQCRSLLNQMTITSFRSDTLSMRLEELHEQYGSNHRDNRSRTVSNETNRESEQSSLEQSHLADRTDVPEEASDETSSDVVDSGKNEDVVDEKVKARLSRVSRIEEEYLQIFHQPPGCSEELASQSTTEPTEINCPASTSDESQSNQEHN